MQITYIFPLALLGTLVSSFLTVATFRSFLAFLNVRRIFAVYYVAVVVHEILHYVVALLCLKWPTWQGVSIIPTNRGLEINGGVAVKTYRYGELLYNIFHGSFVEESLYLLQQLLAGFFIGLGPMIMIYSLLFYFFQTQGISMTVSSFFQSFNLSTWGILFLIFPFIFFGTLVSSPSWADMKQALPLCIILFFIPVPHEITDFLFCISLVLIASIVLILIFRLLISIMRVITRR